MNFTPPSRWTGMRDFFAAIRELLVILAILTFVIMPARIKQFLYDSDIRSVAGIEFNWEKYNEAKREIQFAQSEMQEIQRQLDLAQQVLAQDTTPQLINNLESNRNAGMMLSNPDKTVDVHGLVNAINSARQRSDGIGHRLDRAEQSLIPPEQLFGRGAENVGDTTRR
ncbi:MAG TPA: hypothetical protein PKD64_04170 [Pirellulaceae bacterium]|nr:hypothetical protein [Pirellulaceae bacterium]HMO91368.1 hypothetical protein [Pirellulaceae bacterium]HMP70240.1 hypothetical protein [Pirellulaceae bacterium]